MSVDHRGRTPVCLPFCQGGLHQEDCPAAAADWYDTHDAITGEAIPRHSMQQLFMTVPEIEVLLAAMAKSVDPKAEPANPTEASAVIWRSDAGPVLKSLATMLTEATY